MYDSFEQRRFYKRLERAGLVKTEAQKKSNREYMRRRRAADPEKARARNRAWNRAHPDKARASVNNWHKANPEKVRANAATWRKAHPETARARTTAWQKANPERVLANTRAYQARKQNLSPPLTPQENAKVVGLYAEARALSELTGEPYHVDHIKPLSKGGLHHPDNMQVLRGIDNLKKGAKYD